MRRIVVCRNPECRVSVERAGGNAQAMKCVEEFFSAWSFLCTVCGMRRVVTKDQMGIGGTFGAGQRNDTGGPAYQPGRYRQGGVTV